jgi:hypothetical protein
MSTVVASFLRRFGFLPCGLILLCSAVPRRNRIRWRPLRVRLHLLPPSPGGRRSGSEWPSYNGGYDATRYSSLSQINTGNVASLTEVIHEPGRA